MSIQDLEKLIRSCRKIELKLKVRSLNNAHKIIRIILNLANSKS
jgi:hypothetical protein